MVEQRPPKPQVSGSSPDSSARFTAHLKLLPPGFGNFAHHLKVMVFIVKTPPYNCDILFVVDGNDAAVRRYIKRNLDSPLDVIAEIDGVGGAWHNEDDAATTQLSSGFQIISLPGIPSTPDDIAILAHEILHAASFILRRAGIEHTESTEEAYAYLTQHITKQAYTKMKYRGR